MTSSVHNDQLIVGLESLHISGPMPVLYALSKPVLEDKWCAVSHYLVVNPDALVDRIALCLALRPSIRLHERWLSTSPQLSARSLPVDVIPSIVIRRDP